MKTYAMNGAGNAFVMIDARGSQGPLSLTGDQVRAIHARHRFDQLLALEPDPVANARLRVWNADGGEVGACGNGARAAAWLMFQTSGDDALTMSSAGGPLAAHRRADGRIEVDLGRPRLDWSEIPLARKMDAARLDYTVDLPGGGQLTRPGAVSMGNPHVVFEVEDIAALPIGEIGAKIETDPLFPERVNAGFAQVRGPRSIRLRVFERGAGLTLACGTGACAALVALHRQGRVEREAEIEADGGLLGVRWASDDHVFLSGPVEMEGEIDLSGLI